MYSKLAKHYDALMLNAAYQKRLNNVINMLNLRLKPVGHPSLTVGADLACGTASFTIKLAEFGFDVFGVDLSSQMLDIAYQKSKSLGLDIKFINQDITKFESICKLDFATCLCDGVNYLKDPKSFFKKVSNSLKKDGVFIFDISSKYKFLNVLSNKTFSEDNQNVTYIWKNVLSKNQDKLFINLTFFEKNGNVFEKFDEQQVEYVYDTNFIKSLLDYDFTTSIYGENFNKTLKPDEMRIHFVAIKK